jgi:hypothetical protein
MISFPRDHERFANIAGGVQNVVVAVGVIVGGVWAILSFGLLGQLQRSRLELESLNRQLNEQAAIELDLEIVPLVVPKDAKRYLRVFVTAENKGNRRARLQLDKKPPLFVMSAAVQEDRTVSFGPALDFFPPPRRRDANAAFMGSKVVRAGTKEDLEFLVTVPNQGLYWVVFNVPVETEDLGPSRESGGAAADSFGGSTDWTTSQFVVVP